MSAILTVNSSPFPHVYVCVFAFRYLCSYLSVHPSVRGEEGGAWLATVLEVEDLDTAERTNTLISMTYLSWMCVNGKPPLTRDLMKPVL